MKGEAGEHILKATEGMSEISDIHLESHILLIQAIVESPAFLKHQPCKEMCKGKGTNRMDFKIF